MRVQARFTRQIISVSPNSFMLCVHAGIPAVGFGLKVVGVALTTTEPELGTSIGLGIVVPPYNILSAGSRIQRLLTVRS